MSETPDKSFRTIRSKIGQGPDPDSIRTAVRLSLVQGSPKIIAERKILLRSDIVKCLKEALK